MIAAFDCSFLHAFGICLTWYAVVILGGLAILLVIGLVNNWGKPR